ncbi:prepilin-type N-terminal cleavage/methylation domain-containing protein [Oleiagrimonas soli]|uniref:General secretion pathway protein I n=1 Tax=Oleiagrimonas soli TaxID=1543381 RepID=A0A841KG39_9GAMM|nr:prepilin-type N-terminal cleavage/methylation domain-containing protein [Oleiagrimonas soli]MBB6184156.1 general secretion pathway protein I [Oleiagrimonas soli]
MRVARPRGFTLIEVIAAIVLLSLAFAALLTTMGNASRLAVNADAHTRAALCAQSAMDSAFVLKPIRAGVIQGRCDKNFHWQLQAQRWQPPNPGKVPVQMNMFRLDLTVLWAQGGHQRQARFCTLRAQDPGRYNPSGLP